jgi:hypothetical protein
MDSSECYPGQRQPEPCRGIGFVSYTGPQRRPHVRPWPPGPLSVDPGQIGFVSHNCPDRRCRPVVGTGKLASFCTIAPAGSAFWWSGPANWLCFAQSPQPLALFMRRARRWHPRAAPRGLGVPARLLPSSRRPSKLALFRGAPARQCLLVVAAGKLALFDACDRSRGVTRTALSCYCVYIYVYFWVDRPSRGLIL